MAVDPLPVYGVLLAGGSGTRLWPVSRERQPKQLVRFVGRDSLVQNTIKRLAPVLEFERMLIVCGREHAHETARQLEQIGVRPEGRIISEPCGRNTGPAVLLALFHILRQEPDAVVGIFPADHAIVNASAFHQRLASAISLARRGHIVTFGITPHCPETGYGYIECGAGIEEGASKVRRFVEKPDHETAQAYIKAGNFLWNSGMFAFKVSVMLDEFQRHCPKLLEKMRSALENEGPSDQAYAGLSGISIDCAIMEKTKKAVVLASNFGWSDIGSWKSLYDFLPKDENRNVFSGDVISKDTRGCLIRGDHRLIATHHVSDLVVVETPDCVFISGMEESRDVKEIVEALKQRDRREYHVHATEHMAWGRRTTVNESESVAILRLVIDPGALIRLEARAASLVHVMVAGGTVEIKMANSERVLTKGQNASFVGTTPVFVSNRQKNPASIVQVEIR